MSHRICPWGLAMLAFVWAAPLWAQPTPPPGDTPAPSPPTREQAIEQLRQAVEQLRQASQVVGDQIQALEGQLEAASRLPAAEPQAAGASSQQIEALRREIAELRAQVEELRTQTTEQNEAVLQDLERRAVFSGIMSHYLRIPQNSYPYVRAFAVILLWNAQISPRLRFYGEVEFEDAAAIGEGAGAVELEQGFGELILTPQIGFRLGVILVPFGKFNRRHEEWRLAFSVRPMANFLIFPSTYADAGVNPFGTLVRSEDFQLSYELAVVNGLDDEIMTEFGGPGLRDARPAFATDNNGGKSVVGRLGLVVGEHLDVGASGYYGQFNDFSEDPDYEAKVMAMVGADVEVTFRRWSARLEAIHILLDEDTLPIDDDDDPETPDVQAELPKSATGFSAETEIQFWPSFLAGSPLAEFPDPVLFIAGRFDYGRVVFPEAPAPKQIVLSGSFGYRPVQRSALRFEIAQGFVLGDGPGLTNRGWGGEDWLASVSFALGF